MSTNRSPRRREQLAAALHPETAAEHNLIDYLAAIVDEQHATLVGLIERRVRAASRAARIHVAQIALAHWLPEPTSPPDAYDVMEEYAAGRNPMTGADPVDQLARDQEVGDERRDGSGP